MRAQTGSTLGQVSAYFEGSEFWATITEALDDPLMNQPESPNLDLAAEVTDVVEKLRRDSMDRRRIELLGLVQAGTATTEQRAEYESLFASMAAAKSGNPLPEERSKL